MRRIATIPALAAVLVLAAAAPAFAVPPSHLSDPFSYGEWIADTERPSEDYRRAVRR